MSKQARAESEARIRRYLPDAAPYPLETLRMQAAKKPTPREQLKKAQARAKRDKLVAKMELALKAHKLPAWKREYMFHDKRKWRFDFAWCPPEIDDNLCRGLPYVALEVQGGIWSNGGHVRGRYYTDNREKANEAQLLGWTVLEVTEAHIDSGQAIDWVKRALGVET